MRLAILLGERSELTDLMKTRITLVVPDVPASESTLIRQSIADMLLGFLPRRSIPAT